MEIPRQSRIPSVSIPFYLTEKFVRIKSVVVALKLFVADTTRLGRTGEGKWDWDVPEPVMWCDLIKLQFGFFLFIGIVVLVVAADLLIKWKYFASPQMNPTIAFLEQKLPFLLIIPWWKL